VTVPWDAVDRLIDRLDTDLVSQHGLGPLAARRLRERGLEVPEELFREDRAARTANLIAPTLLTRARAAYDGPLLLLKGPELSRRYPERARRFGDLDLLPGDADAAQAALLAAGFRLQERDWPPEGYDDARRPHYHLHPLEWPGLGLRIEIHRHVKWPDGLEPPPNDAFFEAASAASVGVDGLLAPHPNHHAILLASHAWGEVPMRRIRELVDVMVFVDDDRRDDLARLARQWRFERAWVATLGVADWILNDQAEPAFVRYWARYLRHLREPTVLEMHLQEWLSPFWLAPPRVAVRRALGAVANDFRPWPDQTWAHKRRQMVRALLHPFSPKSAHDRRSGLGDHRRPSRPPTDTTGA
jgi:putative nucleotidyltransferase-like protein